MTYCILIQLAAVFKMTVPTEVLMIIEGEFNQSYVFVCPLCTLVNFESFCVIGIFCLKIPSECQSVGLQIRTDILITVHVV